MEKKSIGKKIAENLLIGIGIGCAIFSLVGMVFDIVNGGISHLENWSYTKQVIGSIIVGAGFSIPAIVYESERLSMWQKVIIHMGIGCTVQLIVAFFVGWIPVECDWKGILFAIAVELFSAFVVWSCFALHYYSLARRMNKKLIEKNK